MVMLRRVARRIRRAPSAPGTYFSAGSSSESLPSSRSLRIAIAVKLLVIDAMRNTVLVSTGVFVAMSRKPVTPMCATLPSMTIAHTAPGMCSRSVNSRMMLSTAGKAARSFASRAGSEKPLCWAASKVGSATRSAGTWRRCIGLWLGMVKHGGEMGRPG